MRDVARSGRAFDAAFGESGSGGTCSEAAGGHWTHDYALTAEEARRLGLPVTVGMPLEVMELMKLYPQLVQRSGVEFLPIDVPPKRQM